MLLFAADRKPGPESDDEPVDSRPNAGLPDEDAAGNAGIRGEPSELSHEKPEEASAIPPVDMADPALAPRPDVEGGKDASQPETPPHTEEYPSARTPSAAPDDLPSYPGRPGSRATRRATERERQRRILEEDEGGLPTYPRSRREGRRYSVLDRLLVLGVTLAAVLLIAYVVTQADKPQDPDNVLVQAVEAAAQAEISLTTSSSRRARQFVQDEFGWTVGVPIFPAAELVGVGIGALAPVIEVPVFFYRDSRGREAVLFSLNYALLDQVPDRVRLRRSDYERLAEDPNPRTHRVGGRQVMLWRDRADIYILVTDIPPDIMAFNIRVTR
jgi:hypothetical protein